MYVKALLVQHDSEIDVNEIRHDTWLYFFNAVIEHAKDIAKFSPSAWRIIKDTLEKHRDDIKSKIQCPEIWDKSWLAYILAPSIAKDADAVYYKFPGRVRNEITDAGDGVIQQCDTRLVKIAENVTDGRFMDDFPTEMVFERLKSLTASTNISDTIEFKRLFPLLALTRHLNTMIRGLIHQQCTRYPFVVDGHSVTFPRNQIEELGIADSGYGNKRYVTNISYNHEVAQNLLDEFEAAVKDIVKYLHSNDN